MKKKDLLPHLVTLILAVLISSLVSVAASGNLFDSNEVVYDNTSSGMSSTNVKTAVDELYAAATDYSNISSRVTNLENHYTANQKLTNISALEINENGYMSTYGGYIDFHYGTASSDFTSRIIEDSSGSLNLYNLNNTAKLRINNSEVLTDNTLQTFNVTNNTTGKLHHGNVWKIGRVIILRIWMSEIPDSLAGNDVTIAKIPTSVAPSAGDVYFPVANAFAPASSYAGCFGHVDNAGNIKVRACSNSGHIMIDAVYVRE